MCKAVQEMNEEARQEGREEGRKEGREEGRKEGRQEGRIEILCDVIKNAMEAFHLSKEETMKRLKVTKEDQIILMKMI